MTASATRHLRAEDLRGRRWRALVRESTEDQAEKWSPERQRSDLRRAAEELGLTPAAPLFYERTGSGESEGAPEVSQAVQDARSGQFDVLLVLATSRLARNVSEARRIKQEAAKAGLVIYFVAERIVSGSFASSLHEGISEVLDEHANEERRFWIAGGLRERQKAGHWSGRVPAGYRRRMVERPDRSVGPDGGLEPDPEVAPVIVRIFRNRLAGFGVRVIARQLNTEGSRNVLGLPWQQRHVLDILRNPVYKGILARYRRNQDFYYPVHDPQDGRQEIRGDWPAIVSATDFDKVQVLLRRQASEIRGTVRSYPLSGILRCARCGRRLSGMYGSSRRYYRCPGRAMMGVCDAGSIPAEQAETTVGDFLSDHRPLPGWEERRTERVVAAEQRTTLQAEKERLTAQLARVREMYEWGELPAAEFKARAAEIRETLAAVQPAASLERLQAYDLASDRWEEMEHDPKGRRALAQSIFRQIVIPPDTRDVSFVLWPDYEPIFADLRVQQGEMAYESTPRYTVRFSA